MTQKTKIAMCACRSVKLDRGQKCEVEIAWAWADYGGVEKTSAQCRDNDVAGLQLQ